MTMYTDICLYNYLIIDGINLSNLQILKGNRRISIGATNLIEMAKNSGTYYAMQMILFYVIRLMRFQNLILQEILM